MATRSTFKMDLQQEEVMTLGRLRARNIAQFQSATRQVHGVKNLIWNNVLKLTVMAAGALLFLAFA